MKLLAALLTLCIASCAPRAIVVDPIAPKAVVVAEKVKRASASAAILHATVSEVHKDAGGIAAEAESIRAEVERMSRLAALAPSDWDAIKILTADHSRTTWALEIKARTSEAQSVTLQADTQAAEREAVELIPHAKATDKQSAELVAKNAALKVDADKWKALRTVVIGGGIIFVLVVGFLLWQRR